MTVTQLGYLGFNVGSTQKLNEWRTLATDVLGCETRGSAEEGSPLYLRIDGQHHRVALYPSDVDGIAHIGWEVASQAMLESLASRLTSNGIKVRVGTPAEKIVRKVIDFFSFRDPAGFPTEIYFGPTIDEAPPKFGRPISGFNTGHLGLGHAVLISKEPRALAKFYIDCLGMRLSDYIVWDEADATFLHCNPRHHSLALMNECYGMKQGEIHHFMLEAKSLDDVGLAYDIVQSRGIPVILTLGKHTNDKMVSFYFKTPSGFAVEYGCGGRLIEDESVWRVQHYGSPKEWGHLLVT